MKRDFELVRKIIRHVADADGYIEFPAPLNTVMPEWGVIGKELAFHVRILMDAKYIIGHVQYRQDSKEYYIEIERLTWDGCEFYESSADDSIWNRAMKFVTKHAPGVTLHVLQTVLARLIMEAINGRP